MFPIPTHIDVCIFLYMYINVYAYVSIHIYIYTGIEKAAHQISMYKRILIHTHTYIYMHT